jgi:hypothetical protein
MLEEAAATLDASPIFSTNKEAWARSIVRVPQPYHSA